MKKAALLLAVIIFAPDLARAAMTGFGVQPVRTCEIVEQALNGANVSSGGSTDVRGQLMNARLYAQLAAHGCAENRERNQTYAKAYIEAARALNEVLNWDNPKAYSAMEEMINQASPKTY